MSVRTSEERLRPFKTPHQAQDELLLWATHVSGAAAPVQLRFNNRRTTPDPTTDHTQPKGPVRSCSMCAFHFPHCVTRYSQWLAEGLLPGTACFHKPRNTLEETAVEGRADQTSDL